MYGAYTLCPTCVEKRKTSSVRLKIIATIGFVLMFSGLTYFVAQHEASYDYGEYKAVIKRTARWLEKEPCDRNKTITLARLLNRTGDYRRTIAVSNRYFTQCEKAFPKLRWFSYSAHRELSELELALADITALKKEDPDDLDYALWRGRLLKEMGQLDEAAKELHDCLSPKSRQCNFELSDVLEKMEQPCEAIVPIDHYLYYHPDETQSARVSKRLKRLNQQADCAPKIKTTGERDVTIQFPKGAERIPIEVMIEGHRVPFILDTGATYMTIDEKIAKTLKWTERPKTSVKLRAATQNVVASLYQANEVTLGSITVEDVPIAVVKKSLQNDGRGLLGLSFLRHFDVDIESSLGRVTLKLKSP